MKQCFTSKDKKKELAAPVFYLKFYPFDYQSPYSHLSLSKSMPIPDLESQRFLKSHKKSMFTLSPNATEIKKTSMQLLY